MNAVAIVALVIGAFFAPALVKGLLTSLDQADQRERQAQAEWFERFMLDADEPSWFRSMVFDEATDPLFHDGGE